LVYLGGDVVVDAREVVAILEVRGLQRTAGARELLGRAAGTGAPGESHRAVVVTTRGLHAVPVTASTVARRVARVSRTAPSKTAEC
jgi:hypothetical protein